MLLSKQTECLAEDIAWLLAGVTPTSCMARCIRRGSSVCQCRALADSHLVAILVDVRLCPLKDVFPR